MFDSTQVIAALNKLIGWRDHYDLANIPTLGSPLNDSSTGEFYQDYHPICDLKVVNAIRPDEQAIGEYLQQKTDAAILQMCNTVLLQKREAHISKGIINDTELIDSTAWINDTVTGESRFVGLAIKLKNDIGLNAVIKRFSGHFTANQTVTFYLYHSSQKVAIGTYDLVIDSAPDVKWFDAEVIEMIARGAELSGGIYYFGYYESGLTGFALNVSNYNWNNYNCSGCGVKIDRKRSMSKIANAVEVLPFYCSNFTADELPAPEDITIDFDNTWGINFSMNIFCDYTQFLIDNAISMKNLIGKSVVYQILKDAQYCQNLNFIEENLRYMITRDLEGPKDSNYISITDQMEREMKAIRFDQSSLSSLCLAAETYKTPIYNQA